MNHNTLAVALARPVVFLLAFAPVGWGFAQDARPAALATSSEGLDENQECTCTCAACLEKHGPKKAKVASSNAQQGARSRGYLGVGLQESEDGVSIENVVPGSPAASAKIEAGDVLFDIDGKSIVSIDDLRDALGDEKAGDEIVVGLMRGGKPTNVTVTLGDESALSGASRPEVAPVTPVLPDIEDARPAAGQRRSARRRVRVELPTVAPPEAVVPKDEPAEPLEWKLEMVDAETARNVRAPDSDGYDGLRETIEKLQERARMLRREIEILKQQLNGRR